MARLWKPDTAHQGSFAYIPYLITGDAFYLDETMFWATYNMTSLNPEYRDYAKGIVESNETRAQAWAMRSLGEAAFATPDSHPMKNHFLTRLDNNLQWYANYYQASNTKVSPLGANENHTDTCCHGSTTSSPSSSPGSVRTTRTVLATTCCG